MSTTTPHLHLARPSLQTTAVSGLALAAVIVFAGNYHVPTGENGGLGPAIVTGIACLAVTAFLYGALLRRNRASDRTAIVLGALAVLSLPVFWSGLTPVLAGAAVAATSEASHVHRSARLAQGLGIVATVITLVVTLAGSHLF